MRRITSGLAAAALAVTVVAAGPAQQSPPEGIDHELEVAKGSTGTVEGTAGSGGTTLADNDPENCNSGDVTWMCEKVLVKFTGSGTADVLLHASYPIADFDLSFYKSDKDGKVGEVVFDSGELPGTDESGSFAAKKGEYYLGVVYYFAAGGGYTLDVTLG